jgi:hypothetical protein
VVDQRVVEFSLIEDPMSLVEIVPMRKHPTTRLSFLIKPILVGLLELGADISASSGNSLFESGSIAGLSALAWLGAVSRFALTRALNNWGPGALVRLLEASSASSDLRLGAALSAARASVQAGVERAQAALRIWTIADARRLPAARTMPAAALPT